MWGPRNHPERRLRGGKTHCATAHRRRGFHPRLEGPEDHTVLGTPTDRNDLGAKEKGREPKT